MVRACRDEEFEIILEIVNDGAQAYRGVIPADRWTEPYMSRQDLRHEIDEGVRFWCLDVEGELAGVMGIQNVQDVALIRHAYVRTLSQKRGIGSQLLTHLLACTSQPVLIGTWTNAVWAIRFYQRHGFQLVDRAEKNRMLKQYWTVPARQIETSVVLANAKWFSTKQTAAAASA
jgi:N-acetylglutamate synthase-like GNAT family acetyltransferase